MSEQTKARIALAVIVALIAGVLYACDRGDTWFDRHEEACRLITKTSIDMMSNPDQSLARADWRLVEEAGEKLDDRDELKAVIAQQSVRDKLTEIELTLMIDDHCKSGNE